jgi:exopolysaccharide biosynthesis operon protein EpsL
MIDCDLLCTDPKSQLAPFPSPAQAPMGGATYRGASTDQRWSRIVIVAACILLAGSLVRPAAAQDDATVTAGDSPSSPLKAMLGGSVSHDANLFRRPDFANPQSDTISTAYARLLIDKPYAQQQFKLDVTSTAYRYDKFSYLNFDALDYQGAWLWHLTPHLSGTLGAKKTENLAPFDETRGIQRSVRITEKRNFDLDGWLFGGWHLLLGISQTDQKSEQPILDGTPDFHAASREAGVQYATLADNSLTVLRRSTRGSYQNQAMTSASSANSDYDENETEFKVSWKSLSGKSTATGRLAWLERTNDDLLQSGFSGPVGDLGLNWKPTDKLQVNLSAKRTLGPFRTLSGVSSVESTTFSLDPTWLASATISVAMRLTRTYSDYPETGLAGAPARKDVIDNAQLTLNWLPRRSVSVGASLQHQRRSSNVPLAGYATTIARINASITF